MAYQKIIIRGFIGGDPEVKYMPSGDAVANFSVAVGEQWKDKSGVKQERTEWFRCTAFGKRGEVIAEHFRKGSGILVEGKQRTDKYTDKNTGEDKYSVQLIVDNFDFIDRKGDSAPSRPQQSAPQAPQAPTPAAGVIDDDIPFARLHSYP